MYGNYCGPYWSDGKWQTSVVGTKPAVDEFDESCRRHDAAYATGADLKKADFDFYRENFGRGVLRTMAAAAVGIQGVLRPNVIDNRVKQPKMNKNTKQSQKKKNLRGASSAPAQVVSARKKLSQMDDAVYAAPTAVATRKVGAKPRITYNSSGVVIRHRSFLGAITNNADYTVTTYPLNPGLSSTFPWLHRLARRYEEYRFRSLRFEYRSVAPTSVAGVVMMSFDYDAADSAPAAKSVQAQTIPNSECNAWMNNDLVVPVEGPFRYVRAGALSSNLDVKTYDMGQMFISSVYGNNVTSGELYIEYEVELRRPTDGPETGGKLVFSTNSANVPFQTLLSQSGSALPLVRESSTTLRFVQSGEFLIIAEGTGSQLGTVSSPSLLSGATGSAVSVIANYAVGAAGSVTAVGSVWRVRAQAGDILTWTAYATATTIGNFTVRIGTAPYVDVA